MSPQTAPIVVCFTSEAQARAVVNQHSGDNGCAKCPPLWAGSAHPLPDSTRCKVFQSAIAYLSAPIEPEPVLPEVRFDATNTASEPLDTTQVFAAVLDLDPADFYHPDETECELTGATR